MVVAFDDFNRADPGTATDTGSYSSSTYLASTPVGSFAWFAAGRPGGSGSVAWRIDTNQAKVVNTGGIGHGLTLVDVGESDGRLEVSVTGSGSSDVGENGLVFRYVDDANYWTFSPRTLDVNLYVAGAPSSFAGSGGSLYPTGTHVAKVVLNGDHIQCYRDNVLVNDIPGESTHQTATAHGLIGYENSFRYDDFGWNYTAPYPLRIVAADGISYRISPTLPNPDGGLVRLVEADGTIWVQDNAGTKPLTVVDSDGTTLTTLTMVFESSGGSGGTGTWSQNVGYGCWEWDAGLWLGGDFTDLAGLPTTLPSGCEELAFWVLKPGEPISNTVASPYTVYWVDGFGHHNTTGGGPTPAASSHMWVHWFGPAFDCTVDPSPPNPPSTYVPAALGQDGTL